MATKALDFALTTNHPFLPTATIAAKPSSSPLKLMVFTVVRCSALPLSSDGAAAHRHWYAAFYQCERLDPCLLFMLFYCATDDVDTGAITHRLRQDGSLIGVLSTEESKTDEQL
ncbi:hypothetical protein RJ640_009979 [Escallonia rubra]|uniref:Uncharacterized protein n=1 Tax=Escallonia rubra TaxID=112253 RepID=A0AA88R677_9ASTE|nr:hypothetical protein RJ640_009979 [Escallonia rubra]